MKWANCEDLCVRRAAWLQVIETKKLRPKSPRKDETVGMRSCERKKVPSWEWKAYLKDTYWFASNCNLPNSPGNLVPEAIPEKLVSKRMLDECFEERGNSQGYMWDRCKMIPVAEIRELVRIVEGEKYVGRNLMSVALAKGIYADRILGLSVNWALYAHRKHREQLIRACHRGLPSPHVNTSLLRVPIRYNPPPPLNLKGKDSLKLKIPIRSEIRADDTRYSSSTEPAVCKLGIKVLGSCDSLKTDAAVDDKDQFSDKTTPVQKQTASSNPFPNDMTGLDKMHAPENVKAGDPPKSSEDFRTEALVRQPLLSVLTPERIQREILRLMQQEKKLWHDISTLTRIRDVVSWEGPKQGPSM